MRAITCILFFLVSSARSRYLGDSVNCVIDEENKNNTVETTYGKIRGSFETTDTEGKGFYAFQSIPFAKPPVGELRFKNPEYPNKWSGILDGTKPPKSCLQPFEQKNSKSEDCLYLNVFTPCLNPSVPLPVIFWIHGGYFLVGNGKMILGEPDLFIDKDVIFVSMNYRLGVFGYLSRNDNVLPGNYALKDQMMALKWAQSNIAKFGGDPKKITIMGQSAGAANVALLMQTPSSRDLFSAAIMDSGNSLNLWSRTKDPAAVADLVANYFNIQYNTSDELIASLQKIDAEDLLFGANNVDLINTALSNPLDGLLFAPSIEPVLEGAVTGLSHKKLKEGNFNRVPVLTGVNSAEGSMFVDVFDTLRIILEVYDLEPSRLAPIDLNTNTTLLHEIGKMIQSSYFQNKSISSSNVNFVKFITDHEFIRPAIEFVRLISKYVPTYFYRFDYVGQITPDGSEREVKGACHGDELIYLFYHSDEISPSESDLVTRERLVRMWTNFAKYHNPTPTVDPVLQNLTWQPAQPTSINYLNIDKDLKNLKDPNWNYTEFWSSIYKNYGIPPFDTY
ncbi:juvenile hormone esterase-like [Harmonia axyridis]|uniref:juvenile hormone esterase-like n=1 Tax=Harmonia axyridis TaxID=115357 RepID=UPI001E2775C6|nr:juvenile hormone esterase-like [Harmonia axyridis]